MSVGMLPNPRSRLLEKFWNTYFRYPIPWRYRPGQQRYWESQQLGDRHGPDKFLEMTSSSAVLVEEVAVRANDVNSKILDLGCNVGRHLFALWQKGFRNLSGVDIQVSALEMMKDRFPVMWRGSSIARASFEGYLPSVPNRSFEIVYTQGATIELVTPSYPICQEVARIAGEYVIIAISESGHLYPRLWETEFARANFMMVKMLRPIASDSAATLMVFRRVGSDK